MRFALTDEIEYVAQFGHMPVLVVGENRQTAVSNTFGIANER